WPRRVAGRLAGVSVVLAAGGVGKTNTAAALAAVHAGQPPRTVLQVGIGGAYPTDDGAALPLGALAVASSEYDLDLGVGEGPDWQGLDAIGFAAVATEPPTYNRFPCHEASSQAVAAAVG